jgi:hypothetical protein
MHYALETEHQTKSSASKRTHESPHIKPKETQMGKQILFFWGSHSND